MIDERLSDGGAQMHQVLGSRFDNNEYQARDLHFSIDFKLGEPDFVMALVNDGEMRVIEPTYD